MSTRESERYFTLAEFTEKLRDLLGALAPWGVGYPQPAGPEELARVHLAGRVREGEAFVADLCPWGARLWIWPGIRRGSPAAVKGWGRIDCYVEWLGFACPERFEYLSYKQRGSGWEERLKNHLIDKMHELFGDPEACAHSIRFDLDRRAILITCVHRHGTSECRGQEAAFMLDRSAAAKAGKGRVQLRPPAGAPDRQPAAAHRPAPPQAELPEPQAEPRAPQAEPAPPEAEPEEPDAPAPMPAPAPAPVPGGPERRGRSRAAPACPAPDEDRLDQILRRLGALEQQMRFCHSDQRQAEERRSLYGIGVSVAVGLVLLALIASAWYSVSRSVRVILEQLPAIAASHPADPS